MNKQYESKVVFDEDEVKKTIMRMSRDKNLTFTCLLVHEIFRATLAADIEAIMLKFEGVKTLVDLTKEISKF